MQTLQTLPGDDVRQIMWRFADRFDLQMAVQSARSVARGAVARLVADGARNSHDWNEQKASLLEAFDAAGLTSIFMDPAQGGFIEGPKNMALALVAFELAWVDGGSATCSLANNLALAPIHEKGTPEQRNFYLSQCVPPQPGEDRKIWRGAFALTEPLPYVGVDTGVLSGRVSVDQWEDGHEPILHVEKRGRFITNMAFANFVTAAVDTGDERIKSSCMIILHEDDPGLYDRGAPTLKMVHQLSATSDPVFNLKVPASRIIGGYTIEDGVIVPRFSHGEIIGAVFHRTRIPVGLMTTAKLLSAVEPVMRYHRQRFRGGDAAQPGTPRYERGLQMNEDALHRLIDVWATGEAGASLGFTAARSADRFDPIEKNAEQYFAENGITGPRAQMQAMRKVHDQVREYIDLVHGTSDQRNMARQAELEADTLTMYTYLATEANILNPACKLWNTGYGATIMREAVSLVGGYGITEDCPGFLGHKWMDTQLEATYEGPEAVQRRHLGATMGDPLFQHTVSAWVRGLQEISCTRPAMGACSLAAALELWQWTLGYLQTARDAEGKRLYHGKRQGVTFPMADALCWLLGSYYFIQDVLELEDKGPNNPVVAAGLEGTLAFFRDLCAVQAARAAGEAVRVCSELVFGYVPHPDCGATCVLPETDTEARCLFPEVETFNALRQKTEACTAAARLAKDRASAALPHVMIPEALDYPL
jgi:alkylation response protein AidB-like acyl-CoA dehydrogenase